MCHSARLPSCWDGLQKLVAPADRPLAPAVDASEAKLVQSAKAARPVPEALPRPSPPAERPAVSGRASPSRHGYLALEEVGAVPSDKDSTIRVTARSASGLPLQRSASRLLFSQGLYCKARLGPGKKAKTRCVRLCADPAWHEPLALRYEGESSLQFLVARRYRLRPIRIVGECTLALAGVPSGGLDAELQLMEPRQRTCAGRLSVFIEVPWGCEGIAPVASTGSTSVVPPVSSTSPPAAVAAAASPEPPLRVGALPEASWRPPASAPAAELRPEPAGEGDPESSDDEALSAAIPAVLPPLPPPAEGPSPCDGERSPLMASLEETWAFLRREHPEEVEAGELQRAIEQSLLDCSVTLRHVSRGEAPLVAPEEVLGVPKDASSSEVKAAYRQKALELHPDKGGDPGAFLSLQRAYHELMVENAGENTTTAPRSQLLALEGPGRDFDLREHRSLVEACFARHGADLARAAELQRRALKELCLEVCEVGSKNNNERGEEMHNQCFYLALARSYLGGDHARSVLEETALHFKRVVEASVLRAHPEWAGQRVGEDVQAFSDFLFFVIGHSHTLLSELAIAVFDSVSGGVEIYRGKYYPENAADKMQRANLIAIYFVPGHYQALARTGEGPTLNELLACLDAHGVLYVVTEE
mmetsp:Transcript_62826/g.138231  ORF Transcript_62826/g.138231 Transcript_62826/m.138231 type:complete len:646 (-) Transcript_62826:48-1985(-)